MRETRCLQLVDNGKGLGFTAGETKNRFGYHVLLRGAGLRPSNLQWALDLAGARAVARFGFHPFFLLGTVDGTAQGNDAVEEGKMLSFRDTLPI